MPADAEGLELVVPAVTLHGMQAECQLEVPVADLRPGSKRPVELTCALGPFPVRAGQVELVERDDGLFVALDVDLGPVVDGRLLVRPGVVLVDGVDRGLTLHWAATRRERAEVIEVPLPPSPGASVLLTLQSPVVELQGPWVIPL